MLFGDGKGAGEERKEEGVPEGVVTRRNAPKKVSVKQLGLIEEARNNQ